MAFLHLWGMQLSAVKNWNQPTGLRFLSSDPWNGELSQSPAGILLCHKMQSKCNKTCNALSKPPLGISVHRDGEFSTALLNSGIEDQVMLL